MLIISSSYCIILYHKYSPHYVDIQKRGITMDVIERLTKEGKDLGYEGETLQTFVKEQQIELRNEGKAMRKAEHERRERREAETDKHVAKTVMREAEAKIEREKAKIERESCEA